jgi:hypothetical protein
MYNEVKRDSITAARHNGQALADEDKNLNRYTASSTSATKETDLLTTAFDKQRGVVEKLQVTLDSQVTDLESATQAVRDYSQR